MAIGTKTGAVSMPSGFNMDVQGMRVRESEPTQDVTKFGDSGNYSRNLGSGTLTMTISLSGFANASAMGLGVVGGAGAAATLTLSTGKIAAGDFIVRDKDFNSNRTEAAVGCTMELVNAGIVTITG